MAVTEDHIRDLEALTAALSRASELLPIVRELWQENQSLRSQLVEMTTSAGALSQVVGQAAEIIRSIDGIYKNPGVTGVVQTNYEDFLKPELRKLHDQIVRGLW